MKKKFKKILKKIGRTNFLDMYLKTELSRRKYRASAIGQVQI